MHAVHSVPRLLLWPEELHTVTSGGAWLSADANGTEVPVSAAVAQLQTQICAQPLVGSWLGRPEVGS